MLACSGNAQQYFFKSYSVESGLPFVQVSCLVQDSNGYLWGGGYGGLTRFDGKKFSNFNRRNGLIDHNVNALCVWDKGRIVIGTNKGLSIYEGHKFINIVNFPDVSQPFVTALCKGNSGAVLIGTTRGLFQMADKKITSVKQLEEYNITSLFRHDSLSVLVGTEKGLVVWGRKTFKLINKAAGLAADRINCITHYRNFTVIGTTEGLSFLDEHNGKIINYKIENGLIDENITALCNQNDKLLWIGSNTGLLKFDGNQFEYYGIASDNNSNHIRCILHDREDNIWLGTNNGTFRYRDNSFVTFDKLSGLGNSFIYQVFRDATGNLWVCSENNGIYRQTGDFFKRYDHRSGLNSATSRSGLQTRDGKIIFGTLNEVTQFSAEHFHPLPVNPKLKGPFDVIYEASDGTLWIGGSNGIASLNWKSGKPLSRYYPIVSRYDFGVFGFCEDDNKNLYVGTFKAGLFMLENDSLVNLSKRLKLNEETFFTLRYIKGKLFAVTLNGLLILDLKTKTLKKISEMDGLNSDLAYTLEFAENKKTLWIGTNQGINKLNLEKYLLTGVVDLVSYGKQEGFTGVECNVNGMWEDKDGTLWIGTVNGLMKHRPADYKRNQTEPRTLIQHIEIQNHDTLLAPASELPSNYNTLAFYYRGICLTNPDKVLYQKKLEGLDKKWSDPGPEDYIKYSNLAPGTYTFKVRSRNNEGVWNEQPTIFKFSIRTPFYATWWFILIAFSLAFLTIYVIFRIRIHKIKRRQKEEFERKVEMSRVELKALRSQMNPHFIFNSLNAIQHYIFNARSDEAIKYLNKFARLVRIILNNSDRPTVTVGDDIEALKLYLELEHMRFEGKFEYEVTIDESVDPDYDIMPPLLMQPYVENAILHGLTPKPVKGKLSIHLSSKNNFLICNITDNGIGREKAAEIRHTMPTKNHKSLGMKITEDRLRILNEINYSKLSVTITDLKDENNNALGTRVELFVPISG